MEKKTLLGFSYKVGNITLSTINDDLKLTDAFLISDVIDHLNEVLKEKNHKVDETSIRLKFVDDQLYAEGFASEIREKREVGFLSGR